MGLLSTFFPILRYLVRPFFSAYYGFLSNLSLHVQKPTASNKANNRSMAVMRRVGLQMVSDKKAEVEQLGKGSDDAGKDLLSILIRANMNENDAERLDDETLLAGERMVYISGLSSRRLN